MTTLERAIANLIWSAKRIDGDGMGCTVLPDEALAVLAELDRLRVAAHEFTWAPDPSIWTTEMIARFNALTPEDVATLLARHDPSEAA